MGQADPTNLSGNGSKGQAPAKPEASSVDEDSTSSSTSGSEEIEGLDGEPGSWGDYPLDELLIRNEMRTIYEVNRRIKQELYIMAPHFQRDFVWDKKKQSKLIESVIMRIPLPVFYLSEDEQGRMIVVDGLQCLSTLIKILTNFPRFQTGSFPPPRSHKTNKLICL